MNANLLSLWLGLAACALAICLSATWMILGSFSGGKLRKLELADKDLEETLEDWYPKRDELRIVLRALLVLDLLFLLYCLSGWDSYCVARGHTSALVRWGVPALAALVYFGATEAIGRHLSLVTSARLLALALPVAQVLGFIAFPITLPPVLAYRWAQRRRDARSEDDEAATAEDEIRSLVEFDGDEDNGDASLEDDERRMIRGIFDLDETLVHEIMTPRVDVDGVEETRSIPDVRQTIVESGHSRIPVFRETIDHIVGVIYAKDLLDEERLSTSASLADLYHHPVFIPETKYIGDLLQEFQQNRNHFAVVLDEYGGTAGIATFEDILEEIVGEIQDEYDDDEVQPTTTVLPDGHLVADARMTIDEVNDALDVDLPEDEDYDTLGGYISAQAGRIPQAGETVETDHLVAEILAADPRRVLRTKVRKRVQQPDADAADEPRA
jgi:CBS domain containing-hemolysin-like protein